MRPLNCWFFQTTEKPSTRWKLINVVLQLDYDDFDDEEGWKGFSGKRQRREVTSLSFTPHHCKLTNESHSWVNFINVFMSSFYASISQKHKKLLDLTVFLCFWGLCALKLLIKCWWNWSRGTKTRQRHSLPRLKIEKNILLSD